MSLIIEWFLRIFLFQTVGNDFVELSKNLRVHKHCLKCTTCGKAPEDDLPMLLGPRHTENFFGQEELDPYCKFCFAKKFKVSAMNIAEIVNLEGQSDGQSLWFYFKS